MKRRPTKDESLATLVKQAEHYANHMMRGASGSVLPTLMALSPTGFIMHLPGKFATEADKDRFAKTGRLTASAR